MSRIGLMVAGGKGLAFLRNYHRLDQHQIAFVASYPSKGLRTDPYVEIREICRTRGYRLLERREVTHEVVAGVDLVFLAGWQYLIGFSDNRVIVLHDSLLPKYRGFSPTVSALINGEPMIGVTAFVPNDSVDQGLICGQEMIPVHYPKTVRSAYDDLGRAYASLVTRVIEQHAQGTLTFTAQDESAASYALWRDPLDLRIDWREYADQIERFVNAVGDPYPGARAFYGEQEIVIEEVAVVPDLRFENRSAGKIWSLANGTPVIVCGKGMLKIERATTPDGGVITWDRLRVRLG